MWRAGDHKFDGLKSWKVDKHEFELTQKRKQDGHDYADTKRVFLGGCDRLVYSLHLQCFVNSITHILAE